MSRTLKRPMFRDGGRANSKGTGIMSGIEERKPYFTGGGVNRNTTLDPYLFSGSPSIMPPPSKELGFSQKLFAVDPTSPVGQLFKDSDRDKDTASEFTKFIE